MASITFGILTVSDTCFANKSKDASGPEAVRLVTDMECKTGSILQGKVLHAEIVPDDKKHIMTTLLKWADRYELNVILTTGGTGFSERDVTPEATRKVIEKEAPGISFALLNKSLSVTPMAMLSRLVCGIRRKSLIINLPGSPKAVKECLETIAVVIPHAINLILGNKQKVIEEHKNIQGGTSVERSLNYENLSSILADVANRLRESPFPMISLADAKKIMKKECPSINDSGSILYNCDLVSLATAHGRILAKPVYSCCDLPPFRASIKDGYAVIAKDGKGFRRVLGGVEAGQTPDTFNLKSGECIRVNTGAPVPNDATAVIQVEDTKLLASSGTEEEKIELLTVPTAGMDIRPVGSDIKKGELVLTALMKLGAVEIGILAACGITEVEVIKIPSVGILSTGNELQTPGNTLKPGHVYDSNKITLMVTLQECGYNPVDCGIALDDMESMVSSIETALKQVDVLITTGSVSMGDKDMLKPILQHVFGATIHFGRVNLKPGKPTTFATCVYHNKKKYLLCLPGNPVSATVTAHLFAIPVLRHLSLNMSEPTYVQAELTTDFQLDPRPEYVRAILKWEDGKSVPKAHSTGKQISSRLLSCRSANAFLILPGRDANRTNLRKGDIVTAMLLGFDAYPITVV